MRLAQKALALGAVLLLLGGCSAVNSLTGQTDDTVLPGQREDAIPGRAQFPDRPDPLVKPSSTAQQQAAPPDATATTDVDDGACTADDPNCQPASNDGVFSDPQ